MAQVILICRKTFWDQKWEDIFGKRKNSDTRSRRLVHRIYGLFGILEPGLKSGSDRCKPRILPHHGLSNRESSDSIQLP